MGAGGKGVRRPAVLDPDESYHLPAEVFVPARPGTASSGAILEVRELTDGRLAMAVYSSMERLIACCGMCQPWIAFGADQLPELQRGGGFDVVVLDVDVPEDLRQCTVGSGDGERTWHDPESADWSLVFVPSRPFRPGDAQAKLELQPMPGDRLALMAYSSRDLLCWGCGPYQPWVSIPAGLLDEARQQAGAHTIALDTPLPGRLRRTAGRGTDHGG
ncbi:MAG: SAV_915 family protein [Pseudonocardiaceae bacterium]